MEIHSDNIKTAYRWLHDKMKEKFERDFNLEKEVTMHEENGDVKIALTPDSSTISQEELLSLSFFVNQINNKEVDF